MDRDAKDRCRGCRHCWDGQCCNISAHVQRAYGMQGDCRFFSEMPPRIVPPRPRMPANPA